MENKVRFTDIMREKHFQDGLETADVNQKYETFSGTLFFKFDLTFALTIR